MSSFEKEKWLEENAERLSRLDRMDRISTSSQNQARRTMNIFLRDKYT